MGYLRPVEELLDSDAFKHHHFNGTSEIYAAAGELERILQLVGHQLLNLAAGLDQLPTEPEGLRTDTMDGVLDPNETVGIAMRELQIAAQDAGDAARHTRAALNQTARLYIDPEAAKGHQA